MAADVDDILSHLIARVGWVRRWLLALSALRIAAAGLACVSLYIGLYAWLDHHVHFSPLARASALALFVIMIAAGLYGIVRVLRRDMTYAHAANYIEGKRSFDQQLVAAVEYYEGRGDYPYSKALAGQLVRQVDREAQEYRFDSTVAKWQGYLLAGFVLLCVCVVGLFVRQNVLYVSSYLARLLRPFSAIQPVPATVLESTAGDIVAGVDAPVTLTAAVQGRVPESVTLVLTRRDPNDANETSSEEAFEGSGRLSSADRRVAASSEAWRWSVSRASCPRFEGETPSTRRGQDGRDTEPSPRPSALTMPPQGTASPQTSSEGSERIELTPTVDADGRARFTTTKSFDAAGRFEYRFETPGVRSDSHAIRVCELPAIKSVTAKVFPPGVAEPTGPQDAGGTPATRDLPPGVDGSRLQDAGKMPATRALPGIEPYEVALTDQPLAVLPHSRIEIQAQATTALREAVVRGVVLGSPTQNSALGPPKAGFQPMSHRQDADATNSHGQDARATTLSLNGADRFGFEFTADSPSSVQLSGVSTDGLASAEAKELRIVLKSDEPPQFKLVSPEADYLATDVASVPISFDVTDDFGLTSAGLVCELPGRDPIVLESASPQGTRQCSLTYTLELEQYDLHVGDGILFYATARDVDTGHRPGDANACSEVYFIEIRPYRQFWHPQPGGSQPNSMPGVPEDLITILEYTRAIVKKTWPLARSSGVVEGDRPKLEALSADVQYCATKLVKVRDDPESGFGEGDKAVLNVILKSYEQAKARLESRDAKAALPPVQEAYRILRMFIDELHLKWNPPQTGPSSPQKTPERVKLQEQPQEPKMEKERVESRLQEMQQTIDSLTRQQKSLKADLAKALQEKDAGAGVKSAGGAGSAQRAGQESQGQSGGEQAAPGQQDQSGTDAGGAEGQGGGESDSLKSTGSGEQGGQAGDGEVGRAGSGRGGQSGRDGRSGQSGDGQAQQAGSGQEAPPNEYPAFGGPNAMNRVWEPFGGGAQAGEKGGQGGAGAARASAEMDARMRMLGARQKALREQVSQLSGEMSGLPASEYSAQGRAKQQAKGHLDQAVEAMEQFEERLADARYESLDLSGAGGMADLADSASRRLADAGRAIQRGLSRDGQGSADTAQEMAEQLAKDAAAYDESLSTAEKQKMLDRLAAAQRLLESMVGTRWTTISSGGGAGAGHVYTNDPHASAAENARLLARQFWSMALEAKKRQSRPVEEESSDVEFFEAENEFFETAARFRLESTQK